MSKHESGTTAGLIDGLDRSNPTPPVCELLSPPEVRLDSHDADTYIDGVKRMSRATIAIVIVTAILVVLSTACSSPDNAEKPGSSSDNQPSSDNSGLENSDATLEADPSDETKPGSYSESPILRDRVERGELPAVEDRLPDEPFVVEPVDRPGTYSNQQPPDHTSVVRRLVGSAPVGGLRCC